MENTNYIKTSSYEGKKWEIKNVLLLYSGWLDTSMMLKWIQDHYEVNVTTLTLDIGQQKDDLDAVKQKALKFWAKKAIVLDAKDDFANNFLSKWIKANASYQWDYHLSTPIGRAVLAKKAVEIAQQEGIECIAHGCTWKWNDQVRIEWYILVLDPTKKIIAPVREWKMDRNEQIAYAEKHNIPVPASIDFPYSVDDNMRWMTWEWWEIEHPHLVAPIEKFLTTYTLPQNAPDQKESVTITFNQGIPTAIDGQKQKLSSIILALNTLWWKHGIGITHMIEDRLVWLKNGGIYEQPGGHIIIQAHKALEKYVSTRQLNEIKSMMDIKWWYLCYGALRYDPAMEAINQFNDFINQKVNGNVTIELFKWNLTIVQIDSPYGLDYTSFNMDEWYDFNVNCSAGFIEIHSLQMKLAYQKK